MSPWAQLDPGTPGGDLLRRAWQPVARSVDLGDRPLRVHALGERLVLYRGASGPRLVQGHCPHRGTDLGLGRIEGDALVCAHHGWCLGPEGPRHRSLPVTEALGLVFAWFGEGDPAPLPRFFDGPWTALGTDRWPCSFFRRLENTLDLWHLPHAHRLSGVGALLPDDMELSVRDLEGGLEVHSPQLPAPPVRFYLPNLLQFTSPGPGGGWVDHLVWRVPEEVDSCRSFSVLRASVDTAARRTPFAPGEVERLGEQVLRGEAGLQDLDSEHLTEIEDYVVLVGQGPLADQPHERLADRDAPLVALRALWTHAVALPTLPRPTLEPLPC